MRAATAAHRMRLLLDPDGPDNEKTDPERTTSAPGLTYIQIALFTR